MAKEIIAYCDPKTNGIRKNTNNTTRDIGYSLSEAPSANVTVSVTITGSKVTRSPTSLTFTTSNWMTPQTITYTAVNDGVVDIVVPETLNLSASGGGYDGVTLTQTIYVYDNVSGTFYYPYFGEPSWIRDIRVTASTYQTVRDAAINFIFNGSGMPSGVGTLTVMSTSHTGTCHTYATSDFTGFSSCRRYRVVTTDVDGFSWTYYAYHFIANTGGSTKVLIDCLGHETDKSQNHDDMGNAALAAGIDYVLISMPVVGENVETNPTITSTGSTGHNQFLTGGLDRVGYSPLELFFFDKVVVINYLLANYSYGTNVFSVGISGGGWTSTLLAGMDTRITKSFSCRGTMPRAFDNGAGDYEQGDVLATSGSRLYTDFYGNTVSIADFIMLACQGGRQHKIIQNTNDNTVGFATHRYWKEKYEFTANQLGGTYKDYIWTASGDSAHAYSATDVAEVINEL